VGAHTYISAVFQALAGEHAGEQWRISVALTASDGGRHHREVHSPDPASAMDSAT
jgi:hypothetical protein